MIPSRDLRSFVLVIPLALAAPAFGEGGADETETGAATFYDESLEGRTTASGERFDPDALTAAHPTHEPGARLRVTNLENDRSVEVRVTDDGPTDENRREGVIIDLSEEAAKRLGLVENGEAPVRVERLDAE